MIDGMEKRLDAFAPSRIRARITALRQRAEQAVTRAEQRRVEHSVKLLVEREPPAASAADAYLTSICPPGLQSTLQKQILIKKMVGNITPNRLTKRCS